MSNISCPRGVAALALVLGLLAGCQTAPSRRVDLLIDNAMILDGRGGEPYRGQIAIGAGRIVAAAPALRGIHPARTVDAGGLAVSPGFINVLSWAPDSLIYDGRGLSDLKQGITLEIFGEGDSYGPLTSESRAEMLKTQGDIRYDITWTSLGEFLEFLVKKGVSPNIASFVGAATVRTHELGYANRAPTAAELARMQDLVRQAMREGALGVGSALIYAPGTYAGTDELTALARAAGEFGGG